jgi:hypothetical protein
MTLRTLLPVCPVVLGVTNDAGTASRCVVVPGQSTGSAVSEGQVVFSVLFLATRFHLGGYERCGCKISLQILAPGVGEETGSLARPRRRKKSKEVRPCMHGIFLHLHRSIRQKEKFLDCIH